MSDDFVKVAEAPNEAEAATICGYLESLGIHATYDAIDLGTDIGLDPAGIDSGHTGHQEILVSPEDLDAARDALAQANRA